MVRQSALFAAALLLSACGSGEPDTAAAPQPPAVTAAAPATPPAAGSAKAEAQVSATVLNFLEVDPVTGPAPVRMLITPDYLRVDGGDSDSGFVLFERKTRRIYSVVHELQRIVLVAPEQTAPETPPDARLEARPVPDSGMPAIGDTQPVHHQFFSNQQHCYDMVNVPGMLDGARAVMQDYERTLAAQQASSLNTLPEDVLTPCYLANTMYDNAHRLQLGFPVEEWGPDGYRRSLVGFEENVKVNASTFEIPFEYQLVNAGVVNM